MRIVVGIRVCVEEVVSVDDWFRNLVVRGRGGWRLAGVLGLGLFVVK